MRIRVVLALVVCIALVTAGCTANPGAEPATTTQSLTTTTTATPLTAQPSGQPITRKTAGDQYLRLVAPLNAAIERCNKHLDALIDGAGPYLPEKKLLENVRTACGRTLQATELFADQVESSEWPDEARSAIQDLVIEVRGTSVAYNRLSKALTYDEVLDAETLFLRDTRTADIVRARLGLPLVGEK